MAFPRRRTAAWCLLVVGAVMFGLGRGAIDLSRHAPPVRFNNDWLGPLKPWVRWGGLTISLGTLLVLVVHNEWFARMIDQRIDTGRCPHCGYSLKGIDRRSLCPECGNDRRRQPRHLTDDPPREPGGERPDRAG